MLDGSSGAGKRVHKCKLAHDGRSAGKLSKGEAQLRLALLLLSSSFFTSSMSFECELLLGD